jgi:hypothetical protein
MRLLTRLFGKPEEINGADRCETYLYRWIMLNTKNVKAYLHHFVGSDWSRDLHDHPKRFISIGIWGSYVEYTPADMADWSNENGQIVNAKTYRAPWIRSFPATHIHRLTATNCWTIVIVLKTVREWGFWNRGRFIHWREYVYGASKHIADESKDCL